jgi:HSP20 family protein
MSVTRFDPWTELATLQRDLLRSSNVWQPTADVYRTDEAFVVLLDVPGIREQDLSVRTEDGKLVVSAQREVEHKVEREQWVRRERAVGQFTRTFTLPDGADPDLITAQLDHGVLEVRIPHAPERQPRQIVVQSSTQAQLDS